jgi:hypothetical protein
MYAAVTSGEAQRSIRTFYEAVNIDQGGFGMPTIIDDSRPAGPDGADISARAAGAGVTWKALRGRKTLGSYAKKKIGAFLSWYFQHVRGCQWYTEKDIAILDSMPPAKRRKYF